MVRLAVKTALQQQQVHGSSCCAFSDLALFTSDLISFPRSGRRLRALAARVSLLLAFYFLPESIYIQIVFKNIFFK